MSPTARRTYLEMTTPADLRPAAAPRDDLEVRLESPCPPELYRALYLGVGEAYRWTDRAAYTDDEIAAFLANPGLEVWTLRVAGNVAGFFELERQPDGSVQIVYFGLLPAFVGQGLGRHMLAEAVRRAWRLQPTRVWLHTCTLDHPSALPNYLARGFRITGTEEYEIT